MVELSVLIPAKNEEQTVAAVVRSVREYCASLGVPYEVILISDGSTDRTEAEATAAGADLVLTGDNGGYGASLMVGAARARGRWLLMTDADGTYPSEAIPRLWQAREGVMSVVGARVGQHVAISRGNRLAKVFLRLFMFLLVGRWCPDFNSGMRLVHASVFNRFKPLFPPRFSLTTTLTAAMLCSGIPLRYEPIDYYERQVPSKFLPVQDGLLLTRAMVRTTFRFAPRRIVGISLGLVLLLMALLFPLV